MTREEVIAKVTEHLLTQGQRCEDAGGVCLYRGPNGLKCAVGCLIKDEFYSPELERKNPDAVHVRSALEASGVPVDEVGMLSLLIELQATHDMHPTHKWPELLKEIR